MSKQPAFTWGLLHGLNDWVAGFMIAHYTLSHSLPQNSFVLVLYAVLGFGGQLPVAMWADKSQRLQPFMRASFILLITCILFFWIHEFTGIVLAGLSSAVLHVTGGSICLQHCNNKTGTLGLFTAPGVLGLTLGVFAANLPVQWLLVPLAATALVWAVSSRQPVVAGLQKQQHNELMDGHDWIMLGILLTVTLRSLVYDIVNQMAHDLPNGLLIIGISAFAGKVAGGFMADKIGWKKWVYITLPLAFIVLQFGAHNVYMLGFGIACLQSSVPVSLLLMRRSIPAYPATATAMTLGVAIAMAGLPLYIVDHFKIQQGWLSNWGMALCTLLVILIVWKTFAGRKLRRSF